MKIIVGNVALVLLASVSWAQPRQFRFFLSYGDAQTVTLARRSGSDPNAAMGREIPPNVSLSVPASSTFRVQVSAEHLVGTYASVDVLDMISFIAYDRAYVRNISSEAVVPLDQYSFGKLAPVHTAVQQLSMNASNHETRIVYDLDGNTVDQNGDGVPDTATMSHGMGLGVGGHVVGSDGNFHVRPIGTAYFLSPMYRLANGFLANGWFRMQPGERMHIFDLEYMNSLQIGETYGYGAGETGLLLHTTGGEQTGRSNNMGFFRNSIRNPEPWQNIGAKYNLIGAAPVPEPNSLFAVALAALLLRRRRAA